MKTLKREEIYANKYDDLEHFTSEHRRVHRGVLQSAALALGARLSNSRRILWAVLVAIRAAKFQSVTTKMGAVTAGVNFPNDGVRKAHFPLFSNCALSCS
jgi:hypothetical protein